MLSISIFAKLDNTYQTLYLMEYRRRSSAIDTTGPAMAMQSAENGTP